MLCASGSMANGTQSSGNFLKEITQVKRSKPHLYYLGKSTILLTEFGLTTGFENRQVWHKADDFRNRTGS